MDHFKRTNNIFGHDVDDRVLQRFSDVARKYDQDGVEGFELGGEEFFVIMSGIPALEAHQILRMIGAYFGA